MLGLLIDLLLTLIINVSEWRWYHKETSKPCESIENYFYKIFSIFQGHYQCLKFDTLICRMNRLVTQGPPNIICNAFYIPD